MRPSVLHIALEMNRIPRGHIPCRFCLHERLVLLNERGCFCSLYNTGRGSSDLSESSQVTTSHIWELFANALRFTPQTPSTRLVDSSQKPFFFSSPL